MNKSQRRDLRAALDAINVGLFADDVATKEPEVLKNAIGTALSALEALVNDLASEERDKFDNMSDGLQNSPTGQAIEEAADTLENISFPDLADYSLETEEGRKSLEMEINDLIEELEALL